jgi:hypothetical protein
MVTIAQEFYNMESKVEQFSMELIWENLSDGLPVLCPYDSDKNGEPFCDTGKSAHWCIIVGVCWKPRLEINGTQFVSQLPHWENNLELAFVCQQPRSKHKGIWWGEKIKQSNSQLLFPKTLDPHLFVVPSNLSELQHKIVTFKKGVVT